jgi:hypothetical protein
MALDDVQQIAQGPGAEAVVAGDPHVRTQPELRSA